MSVRVKVARDAATLDAVFRVRHEVFAGGGYMPTTPSGRIVSHLDAVPGSVNLVALVEDTVVGGIRVDLPGPVPSGADELFDFSPYVREPATVAATSLLCVLPEYRKMRGINRSLWQMAGYVASVAGMKAIKGSANPERRSMFLELGFEILSETFHHDASGLDVLPIMLDLKRANQRTLDFMARQNLGPFEDVFDRLFVPAGETLIRQGEPGEEAYLLIHGEVNVAAANGARFTLHSGELFGELALIADRPRTASVTASTDVELMALSRESFEAQLAARPAVAVAVLRTIATRLADAMVGAAPGRSAL